MTHKKALGSLLVIGGMLTGVVGSVALSTHAQTAPATTTGTSVVAEQENHGSGHEMVDQAATEAKATVKSAQAVATAEASVGEKSLRSHIEDENGTVSYDIFFATKKVEVDGRTGAITKTEAKQDRGNEGKNEAPGTEVPDAQEAGN